MTLRQLYLRAAHLVHGHRRANERAAALDAITDRRVRIDADTLWWRKAASRAARVTMDRGFDAVVARVAARDRMDEELPWRSDEEQARAAARWWS